MESEVKTALDETLDAIERLLRLFRVERTLHLIIGVVAFGLLAYALVLLFRGKGIDTATLVSLFGSSGLVTVSSARLVYFFNRAFKLVEHVVHKRIETKTRVSKTK